MEVSTPPLIDISKADDVQPRAERREHQVRRILDAAKACFVRRGFQGASMQEICAAVGMSPGALYRYFPSKEAIIEAIVEQDRSCDAEMLGRVASAPSVLEGVVGAAMDHIRMMHETGNAPLFTEIRAESMRNETVQAACMMCMEDVAASFHERLALAIEKGEIDPVVPVDALVPMLMAIGEGMAMNDLLTQGVAESDIETALRAAAGAILRPRADPKTLC